MGIKRANYVAMPAQKERKMRIENFFKGLDVAKNESVLPLDTAKMGYNFEFRSGALTDGHGIEELLNVGRSVKSLLTFNKNGEKVLMFVDFEGYLYRVWDDSTVEQLFNIRLEGDIFATNYRLYGEDVMLICSSKSDMVVYNGEDIPFSVLGSPRVKSMTVFGSRLLIIEENRLRYSMDLDPTNWVSGAGQGGDIEFSDDKGRPNRVISLQNYAYVFRDFGISRLSFSGGGVTATNIFASCGRIFPDTITEAGDKIIFMATDGIYVFDGLNTKRVLSNLFGCFLPDASACATFFDGKYHLAIKLNPAFFDEDLDENGLLIFDYASGEYCICRGLSVDSFCEFGADLLALSGGKICKKVEKSVNFGEDLVRKWSGAFTDLGTNKLKHLRKIQLDSNVPLRMIIRADESERAFDFEANQGEIRVNMRGKKLGFSIETSAKNPIISRPTLVLSD